MSKIFRTIGLAFVLAIAALAPAERAPAAISATGSIAQYTGNGTTTAFSFLYPYFLSTDLTVTLTNPTTGQPVSPAPVLNGGGTYDYTVAGVSAFSYPSNNVTEFASATVTFNTAPPANYQITLQRAVPSTQLLNLLDNAPMPASSINAQLDKLTMLAQQNSASLGRMIQIPAADPSGLTTTLPGAATRANMYLSFDASGNATVSSASGSANPTGPAGGVLSGTYPNPGFSSSTGSGAVVQATSPTLTTPNLGTPSAIVLTNATGLPLTNGDIFVGNGSNVATGVAMSGDATLANTGAITVGKIGGKAVSLGAALTTTGAGAPTLGFGSSAASYNFPGAIGSVAGTPTMLSTAGATLQAAPTNPTSTTSTTGVMMGLGSICAITPKYSSRVFVAIEGMGETNTNGDGWEGKLQYGTGAAPINGASGTGTSIGGALGAVGVQGGVLNMFNLSGIAVNLTPGTAYWFDVQLQAVTGGTALIANIGCTAFEM